MRTGLFQDLCPEREDEPAVFGEANEFNRRNIAEHGMQPARQGFKAANTRLFDGVDRLECYLDRPCLNTGAQLRFHVPTAAHLGAQRGVEELHPVFSELFGTVHGVVGRPQEIVGIFTRIG